VCGGQPGPSTVKNWYFPWWAKAAIPWRQSAKIHGASCSVGVVEPRIACPPLTKFRAPEPTWSNTSGSGYCTRRATLGSSARLLQGFCQPPEKCGHDLQEGRRRPPCKTRREKAESLVRIAKRAGMSGRLNHSTGSYASSASGDDSKLVVMARKTAPSSSNSRSSAWQRSRQHAVSVRKPRIRAVLTKSR